MLLQLAEYRIDPALALERDGLGRSAQPETIPGGDLLIRPNDHRSARAQGGLPKAFEKFKPVGPWHQEIKNDGGKLFVSSRLEAALRVGHTKCFIVQLLECGRSQFEGFPIVVDNEILLSFSALIPAR